MFDDSKLLKNRRSLQAIARELHQTKAEILFENARRLQASLPEHEFELEGLVYETVAEQFILLGGRSEFLEDITPLDRTQLKNIQRRLEKQGVMDGVVHAKRTLTGVERTVKLYLGKGRIVVSLFLMIYEQLAQEDRQTRINLYRFLLAYFLTKEIFEHPQIFTVDAPTLPVDLAFFFCREWLLGQAQMFYCPQCGQVYTVFTFEISDEYGIKCPYCSLLSSTKQNELKSRLKTGFV